ncbi:8503_t:CDS:2, partial [Diversispora eburnea]
STKSQPFIPSYLKNTPIDLHNKTSKNVIQLPTKWNKLDAGSDIKVRENELCAEAIAAAIRTDNPIPVKAGIYYFEIDIIFGGKDNIVGIGIGTKKYGLTLMPGWDWHSFGYHSDDGRTFFNGHRWERDPYGPLYSTGDIIGCCVDFFSKTVFYTKNGINLGNIQVIHGDIYPVIGMKNQPVCIEANFGTKPFKFDIENYTKIRFKEIGDSSPYINFDEYESSFVNNFLMNIENLDDNLVNNLFSGDIENLDENNGENEYQEMKICDY